MITFEGFRPEDGVPIYLQIIKYLKQGIVSGAVADRGRAPSRPGALGHAGREPEHCAEGLPDA